MLGPALGAGDRAMGGTDQAPALRQLIFPQGRQTTNQLTQGMMHWQAVRSALKENQAGKGVENYGGGVWASNLCRAVREGLPEEVTLERRPAGSEGRRQLGAEHFRSEQFRSTQEQSSKVGQAHCFGEEQKGRCGSRI